MSTYTLEQAIKPSRASIVSTLSGGKAREEDDELPDYISPEPKNAAERRDWERMSSRMEGAPRFPSLPSLPPETDLAVAPCRLPRVL